MSKKWHHHDRIQYDGNPADGAPLLDEIVVHDATVHLEGMTTHGWWGQIDLPTGGSITLRFKDLWIEHDGDVPPVTVREPLLDESYWLDRDGLYHACDTSYSGHDHRCRCECDKRKPGGTQ